MTSYGETALVRSMSYLADVQAAISHNLANVDTTAFKRRAPMAIESNRLFDTILGQQLPMVRYAEATDFRIGTAHETGNRFDVALGDGTWFRVQDPKGATFLTRNGQLQIDRDGYLVTHDGMRYLDQAGNPVQLSNGGEAPSDIAIAPNGQVSDPLTGQTWGPIGVFKVPKPQQLVPQGGGIYSDPSNQPLQLAADGVQQGYQEGSNVDSLQEMVQMILVERRFSATQRALGSLGRMHDRLIENVNR